MTAAHCRELNIVVYAVRFFQPCRALKGFVQSVQLRGKTRQILDVDVHKRVRRKPVAYDLDAKVCINFEEADFWRISGNKLHEKRRTSNEEDDGDDQDLEAYNSWGITKMGLDTANAILSLYLNIAKIG